MSTSTPLPSSFRVEALSAMSSPADLVLTAITEAEDAEYDKDLRDNNARSNKTPSALKHFNYFLKVYCDKRYPNWEPKITSADQLSYRGLDGVVPFDNSPNPHQTWWSELIGSFFNYLSYHAHKYCNPEKALLGEESAAGYASAVKSYFVNRFRNEQPLLVFNDPEWRSLRNLMMRKFEERGKRTGERVSTPRTASNSDDRKAMGSACFWLATSDAAEFHCLNVLTYHLCGRGRECSVLKPEDIYISLIDEDVHSYRVLSVNIQCDKGGPEQDLNLYPHKNSLQEDPYFAVIYLLLVGSCNKPDLLPKFSAEASKVDKNNKSASRVGSFWTTCFHGIKKEFQSLSDILNDKLTSYHSRKGANQKLAETSSVCGYAQIFRSGWEVRAVHSVFDYVVGSKVLTNQAGKALSCWTVKGLNGEIVGGLPPTLVSVKTHREPLDDFVHVLFVDDIGNRWPASIRVLLTASLLKWYDDFVAVIQEHPKGVYEDFSRHPLVHAVERACVSAKVDGETFKSWCREVRDGFSINNYAALPYDMLPKAHNILVDPRSMIDFFNTLTSSFNGLFNQKMVLEEDVVSLRRENAQQTRTIERLERVVTDLQTSNKRIVDVLELKYDKKPLANRKPVPQTSVMFFSDVKFPDTLTLEEMFLKYFKERCIEGYQLELKSDEYAKRLKGEQGKIKSRYKKMKKAVKVLLHFCDHYPQEVPEDPKDLSNWVRDTTVLAEAAVKRLSESDLFPEPPSNKGLKVSHLQRIHPENRCPEKTPQYARQHFDFPQEGRTSPIPPIAHKSKE